MSTCTVPGCDRPVMARGWCARHYKRWRATGDEPQPDREVGTPDGHGRYGVMERHEDAALCHECGSWYVSVAAHIGPAHNMTAADYRQAHGLPRRQPLVSLARSRQISERSTARVGSAAWRRLEAARDPQAAADARTPDMWQAPASRDARAARATDGRMDLHQKPAVKTCRICGREYTGRARTCSPECAAQAKADDARRQKTKPSLTDGQAEALRRTTGHARADEITRLQSEGYSSRSIGAAIGLGPAAMSRRYPQP